MCLRLLRDSANANLRDTLSVLLTFPGFRSVGLYWDSSSLADDLPLLQTKRDRDDPVVSAMPYEEFGAPGIRQFEEFLQADLAEIVLPVAAARDAQTLLKRQVGAAYAVCLNVPMELRTLADTLARAYPDARFFGLSPAPPQMGTAANIQSFFGHGLTQHDRMAVARAADATSGASTNWAAPR